MLSLLFTSTAVLYAISCVAFLVFLFKDRQRVGSFATMTLGVAALSHIGFLAADYARVGEMPLENIHQVLSVASLAIVLGYLAGRTRYPITVLGGFITPVTLLFFLSSALGTSVEHVPEEVRSALMPVHVGANILGVATFALASATAAAYLIQERLLRRKRVGGLFRRLPALDVLDSLAFRLILLGFFLFTIGVVTGAMWSFRIDPSAPPFSVAQVFALLTWAVFAGVLLLRVAAGWQGRRAAIGTVFGFLCAMVVLVGYMLRSGSAS